MLKYLISIAIWLGLAFMPVALSSQKPTSAVTWVNTRQGIQDAQGYAGAKVIMFSADWCGYCQKMKPILAELSVAPQYTNKVRFFVIDVDATMTPMDNGIPVILVSKPGKPNLVIEGAVSKEALDKAITDYLKRG